MHVGTTVIVLGLIAIALSGCSGDAPGPVGPTDPGDTFKLDSPHRVLASDGLGANLTLKDALGNLTTILGSLHVVGEPGAEPSIGVTSAGNIFFQAFEKTMRSTDHGKTFERVQDVLTATDTSDPYLWVDPTTDRVFQINMVDLLCSHIAWSDDEGDSWLGNPLDCGPVPVNDHIKLATGPWTGALDTLTGVNPVYPNAVYYAYNKLVGGFMAVSLDGGATFPILSQMFESGCNGALHGAITTAPDGTVYVPARYCPGPLVAMSKDNGVTWTQTVVGEDVGVPDQQKNPEIGVDAANNAYITWVGEDNRLHMTVSKDSGDSWEEKSIRVTPEEIGSVVWPTLVAGDAGRIGLAYIGTEESTKGPWEVENGTRWHLYYTYSLNALDANPTFITIRLTSGGDPVQVGTICVASGSCMNGNRNLLDFIDLVIDSEGRPYIAYADGCVSDKCKSSGAKPEDSRSRDGMVAILQAGPSLYEAVGILEPLDAPAPETT